MRFHLFIQRHGLPVTRILWTTSPPSFFSQRSGPSSVPNSSYTIAQFLEDVNELIPLETETGLFENESGGQWGLEDYVVEVGGFECLHFMEVDGLLRDGDEVVIRALQLADLRARRISGRHQISADGKHLIDGVPFGRPYLKRAAPSRPAITIPPRKKRRTLLSGWSGGIPNDEEDADWVPMPEDSGNPLALIPDDAVDEDSAIRHIQDTEDAPASESDADESEVEDLTDELEELKEDQGPSDIHDSTDAYSLRGRKRKASQTPETSSVRSLSISRPADEKPPANASPKAKSVRFNKQTEELPTSPKAKQPSSSDVDMSTSESSCSDTTSDEDSSEDEDESSSSVSASDSGSDSDEDEDEDTSSDSSDEDEETSTDESIDTKSSKASLQPKVSPPGQGSTQTKKSNLRTKLRRRLKKLKELGALPEEATFQDLRMFDETHPGPYPEPSGMAQPKAQEQEQAEFEAKRQKLLQDLESGGIDVDATSEKENVPPSLADTQGDVSETVAETEIQPAEAEVSKKRSLDVAASKRLLFGSLGVRTPRTKEDEEATRKKLAGKVRQFQPQEKPEQEAVEPESESDVDWQGKVTLKATECLYDDIKLKDPSFPFEQRWDRDAWNMIRQRKGLGRKRKRGRKSYGYDGEADEYQDSDHYFNGDSELNYDENVDYGNGVEGDVAATTEGNADADTVPEEDADDFPFPDDSMADLTESEVKKGSIIAFKQLDMSKATNWQPKVSDYRVAKVHSDPSDGIFKVRLAKRDRRKKEEDGEGNRRYSGFEMPGFEDVGEDDGFRDLPFADLMEPKLLRAVAATQTSKPLAAAVLNESVSSSPSSLRCPPSSPPAEAWYNGKENGTDIRSCPFPVNGKKGWKLLPVADIASLGTWSARRGDVVAVCLNSGREGFAKISDMRRGDDGRHHVVYTWLYTRGEVVEDLHREGVERTHKRLARKWPAEAPFKYMLSTDRTVTLLDTALSRAPEGVTSQICSEWIYNTTRRRRKICSVDGFPWMKRILELEPPELPDQEAVRETPAEQVEQRSVSPFVRSPSFTGFQSLGSDWGRSENDDNDETPAVNEDEGADPSPEGDNAATQASKSQDLVSSPKTHTSFDVMLDEFIQGSMQDRSSVSNEAEGGDDADQSGNGNQEQERPESAANALDEAGKVSEEGGRMASEELQGEDSSRQDLFPNPKSPTSYQPNGSGKSSQAESTANSGLNVKDEASQPPKSSQKVDIVDLTQESPVESEDEAEGVQRNRRSTRASTGMQEMKEVSISPPKIRRTRRVSD